MLQTLQQKKQNTKWDGGKSFPILLPKFSNHSPTQNAEQTGSKSSN